MGRTAFTAGTAALLGVLAFSPLALAQNNNLTGCLSGEPDNYVLSAEPSGNLYRLQGNTGALSGYSHYLIRVTGSEIVHASPTQPGTFKAENVQAISDSCTTPLPPQNPAAIRPVTGSTAPQGTAINASSTKTVTETTPGVQTAAGEAQQPGVHVQAVPGQYQPPKRGVLAPPVWEQAGQAPQEGNTNADAVQQTEEQPSSTLGVNAMPPYANPQQPQGKPATQGGTGVGMPQR
jgi:hypothetical protein